MRPTPTTNDVPLTTGRFKPLVSLKAHRTLSLLLILFLSGLGVTIALLTGKTYYQVSASVLVTPKYAPNLEEKAADFDKLGSIEYAMYIKQQQNLMTHPRVLKKALERTEVKAAWPPAATEITADDLKRLRQGFTTNNKRGEPFIQLILSSEQAQGLDVVLNAIVDIYLQESRADTLYNSSGRVILLQQEIDKLKKVIEKQQQRRAEIAQKLGVTTFKEDDLVPYDSVLIESTTAYKTARRQRITAQASYDSVAQSPATLEALIQEKVANDVVLTNLKTGLIARRTELQKQLLGLTADHPGRAPVDQEIKKIEEDIANAEQTLFQEIKHRILNNHRAEVTQTQEIEDALLNEMEVQREQANQYASLYNEGMVLNKQIERTQRQIDKMNDRIDLLNIESDAPGFVRSAARAVPTNIPISNRSKLILLFLVAAFGAGLTLPIMIDLLDRRIQTPSEIHKILGFAPLVWILEWHNQPTRQFAQDQLRRLALTLDRDRRRYQSTCFALTAVKAGGGTTTLTLQLARCLTELGIRTLAVEINAFKPDNRYQGEMPSLGLTALLNHEGRIALEEYLLPATETLPVRLPVGTTTERHLVTNGKLPALLTELNRYYDLVLLDSPPILLSADTERLSEISGGVLLIVEAGQTQPGELKRAAHLLERLSPPVIATILNRAKIYQGGGYFAELLEEYTTGHKPKHHWIKKLFT